MNVVSRDKTTKGMLAITPHDTNEIDQRYASGLYIADTSADTHTLKVQFIDGTEYTFGAGELAYKETINASIKIVYDTGTDMTDIYGIRDQM